MDPETLAVLGTVYDSVFKKLCDESPETQFRADIKDHLAKILMDQAERQTPDPAVLESYALHRMRRYRRLGVDPSL